MATTPKKKKPRNPNDATFRNVRALKARVRELEDYVRLLSRRLAQLEKRR